MSSYTGVESRFRIVAKSFNDKEFIDYNVKYEVKTVIDGHDSGSLAGVAIGGIVVGAILGLAIISSLFQIPIAGITVPRLGAK